MEDQWITYPTNLKTKHKFALVNLAYEERWNSVAKPVVLWVSVPFVDPGPGGFGAEHEVEAFGEVEDRLVDELAKKAKGLHVARLRGDGAIRLCFYLPENGAERAAEIVAARLGKREHECAACADPQWREYRALLPTPKQRQWTMDEMLLHQIAGGGNDLTRARPVEFCLFMHDEESAGRLARHAARNGFEISRLERSPEAGDLPVTLELTRKMTLEPKGVHACSDLLVDLVAKHGGVYDGWSTVTDAALNKQAR